MSKQWASSFITLSEYTVTEWANISQSYISASQWQFYELCIGCVSSSGRKTCCERQKNSWNWFIFFIRAIMLLIAWTKDPGTMWLLRYEMTLHKLAISFRIHECISLLWGLLGMRAFSILRMSFGKRQQQLGHETVGLQISKFSVFCSLVKSMRF